MASKEYHKKKRKEWYEADKKTKKAYHELGTHGISYTDFKRRHKKHLG